MRPRPTSASPSWSATAPTRMSRSFPNPPIDAKAMAAVLRNVGFDVVEGTNLTRDKMTEQAARIRQEGARRRRRGVLLCRPRHRHQRHQLSAADRCRHQIGNGRQARRRDQHRPHARPDHERRQGQAGVPRCLPRQSVRRQDQVEFRDPQRLGATGSCRNEIRRRHADRLRHRSRTDRARRPGRHQQPVHPCADRPHHRSPASRSSRR